MKLILLPAIVNQVTPLIQRLLTSTKGNMLPFQDRTLCITLPKMRARSLRKQRGKHVMPSKVEKKVERRRNIEENINK